MMQFADALQQTIQMGVDAQAQENKNARMDKQFEKVKVFDGSKPSECHPWLEEVHALCIQTGRPFCKMLLLCAGQAVHDFITDMSPEATDDQIKNDLITGYSDLQGLGCKQAAYNNIMQRPDKPLRSYIMRYSRMFKLLNGTAPDDVKMRTTSMHFVNSVRNYLSSKVKNRLLGMNERNYSLGDTFKVALECELKAIASERRHTKRTTGLTNQVEVVQPQAPLQSEEVSEVHVCNPNYKGKNYDPNFQAKCAEATHSTPHNSKQQQNSFTMTNQYKTTYNKPTSMYGTSNNTPLTNSSDIVGEVTLKTSVDGYQLLKVNEMIKNAVAFRVRMPKTSKFSKYFDNNAQEGTQGTPEPKVHINEATLKVMGKAAKDFSYMEQEFVEAVEMYQYFGNQNLEDVPNPNSQDWLPKHYRPDGYYKDVHSTDKHFVDICTIAVGPATGTVFPISSLGLKINALYDTGATKSCMSLKTFESLTLKLTKDKCPFIVTVTGTSMEPIGFTECSFDINGHSFTQKFIVCNNQTRPIILGKDFASQNCIGIVWTKQGSRKMIDDDCKVIMEVHEQTTDIPLSLTNSIRIPPHTIAVAVVECAKPLNSTVDIRAD